MKKLKTWQIVLLVIFYPVGIAYLIIKIVRKIQEPAQYSTTPLVPYAPQKSAFVPQSAAPVVAERVDKEEIRCRQEEFVRNAKERFSNAVADIPRIDIAVSNEKATRRLPSEMPEIKFTNITRATDISKLFPLVVLDVETTGLSVRGNDIIEVSAIKFDVDFTPVSCFTKLLKPRGGIPAEATAVNHITDDMVSGSPAFSAVAPAFSEYISGCNIVGHNVGFDLKFLFVCGADLPQKVRYYDTLELAKKTLTVYGSRKYNHHSGEYEETDEFDVIDYKLETLCEHYSIYRNDAHRSLSDCFATAKLFEEIIDDKTA